MDPGSHRTDPLRRTWSSPAPGTASGHPVRRHGTQPWWKWNCRCMHVFDELLFMPLFISLESLIYRLLRLKWLWNSCQSMARNRFGKLANLGTVWDFNQAWSPAVWNLTITFLLVLSFHIGHIRNTMNWQAFFLLYMQAASMKLPLFVLIALEFI